MAPTFVAIFIETGTIRYVIKNAIAAAAMQVTGTESTNPPLFKLKASSIASHLKTCGKKTKGRGCAITYI